jgi:hypothetical protein
MLDCSGSVQHGETFGPTASGKALGTLEKRLVEIRACSATTAHGPHPVEGHDARSHRARPCSSTGLQVPPSLGGPAGQTRPGIPAAEEDHRGARMLLACPFMPAPQATDRPPRLLGTKARPQRGARPRKPSATAVAWMEGACSVGMRNARTRANEHETRSISRRRKTSRPLIRLLQMVSMSCFQRPISRRTPEV